MISARHELSNFQGSEERTMQKFEQLKEKCQDLFEDYLYTTDRTQKATILVELMSNQKYFDQLTSTLANDEPFMRIITALRMSFEKVEKEVIYFGGLDEIKKSKLSSRDRTGVNTDEPGSVLRSLRNNPDLEHTAYHKYQSDMQPYDKNKHNFEAMDEFSKREAIDKMLDDLKYKSGFDVGEKLNVSHLSPEARRKSDLSVLMKLKQEINNIEEQQAKESDPVKKVELETKKQEIKKVTGFMGGLKSFFGGIFSKRNPVVKFFASMFKSKKKNAATGKKDMGNPSLSSGIPADAEFRVIEDRKSDRPTNGFNHFQLGPK